MEEHHKGNDIILKIAGQAERFILIALLGTLLVVVAVGALELVLSVVSTVINPGDWESLYGADALFKLFEFFFVVLIGVELLETVRVYLEENVIHVEAVLLVAITAVARKVIVLELGKYQPVSIIGLGLLVIALTGGYYLLRHSLPKAKGGKGTKAEGAEKPSPLEVAE